MTVLKAPFPWFGGKSRVAPMVWRYFGQVKNYVEPFFGSGAVLLGRPTPFESAETVNDKDGFVANFWRSVQSDPEQVAYHADWPVNETDLHARHVSLLPVAAELNERLLADPAYFDARVAGWWVWGVSSWIGSGWCSGEGPWNVVDGRFQRTGKPGVNRKIPHLTDSRMGVHRKLPAIGHSGKGVHRRSGAFGAMLLHLSERLRRVRVCSGDWSRICNPSSMVRFFTSHPVLTAVFLDPPYSDKANRHSNIYAQDSASVAHCVREWAIANGDNPLLRIALCGYEGEHEMPESWGCVAGNSNGGYANRRPDNTNKYRERIWFSPHCVKQEGPLDIFDIMAELKGVV